MQFKEIPVGEFTEVIIRPKDDEDFGMDFSEPIEAEFTFLRDLDEFVLRVKDRHWPVCADTPQQQALLWEAATGDRPKVYWIQNAKAGQPRARKLVLSVRQFDHFRQLPSGETYEFPVREGHFEFLRKTILQRPSATEDELLKYLKDHVLIQSLGRTLLLISSGQTGLEQQESSSFRILGHRVALNVELRDHVHEISRIVSLKGSTDPVIVLEGKFDFVNASVQSQFRQSSMPELDRIVSTAGSYLGIWDEYNRLERRILIQKARQFGWIRYDQVTTLPTGWRLHIKGRQAEKLEQIRAVEELDYEISGLLPHELEDDFSFDDSEEEDGEQKGPLGLGVTCKGIDVDRGWLDVAPLDFDREAKPPEKGFFFASLSGDWVRLKRRRAAWDAVRNNRSQIPMLGLLIERSNQFVARSFPAQNLNDREIRRLFGGEPNAAQLKAIKIALNTPDIALIQGPPGTGKTRVISALAKILSGDRILQTGVAGHILITSYQHDAVANAANRSSVFGLPALKVGRRRTSDILKDDADQARQWSEHIVNDLKNDPARPGVSPLITTARRVHAQLLGYMQNPGTVQDTVRMLRDIYADTLNIVPTEESDHLLEFMRRYQSSTSSLLTRLEGEKELILKSVRGLRTTPEAFSDDGSDCAYALLSRAGKVGLLDETESNLLRRASEWDVPEAPDFLPALLDLQQRLIEHLTAPVILDRANLKNAEVESLLIQLDACLMQQIYQAANDPEALVEQFITDLENDPYAVRETLLHYTAVLAATCQQSVGQGMQKAKNLDEAEKGASLVFENVIVDEAARSNPLDLLIPMNIAQRRIILVGDHRQLPHMLEPEVERGLEHSAEAAKEALGKSLFHRLFTYLAERVNIDGIARTITLNQQYRMHPLLGEFVSRVFYERHNPDEAFRSDGVDATDLSHRLDGYEGKVAAWIDVPRKYGSEDGIHSKRRRREASFIAQEAEKILKDDPNLTVGVITFYSDQVIEILKEMRRNGLAEEAEGELRVHTNWTGHGTERLRVGTVDAFQGMEFDIVLLSMVRCNDIELVPGDEYSYRRKYGFLTLENRLCVAMSRQKRLLIMVGDAEMIRNPAAAEAVPGLTAFFHDLCEGPHGTIHRL